MDLKIDIKAAAAWIDLDLEETRTAMKYFSVEAFECIHICHILAKNIKYPELIKALNGLAGTAAMLHLEQINRYALKIAEGAREAKPNVVDNILPLLEGSIEELRIAAY